MSKLYKNILTTGIFIFVTSIGFGISIFAIDYFSAESYYFSRLYFNLVCYLILVIILPATLITGLFYIKLYAKRRKLTMLVLTPLIGSCVMLIWSSILIGLLSHGNLFNHQAIDFLLRAIMLIIISIPSMILATLIANSLMYNN